jgi:cytidylate kinase
MEVNGSVSFFSTISQVRTKLVDIQKSLAERKGFVMDGRDIGTVVLTNAELKLFLTCDLETRVMRRKKELDDKNILATFESVRENFLERDYIDSTRADSPLIRASDALLIDNSTLTQEALLSYCLELVAEKLKVY